jgi:phosphomannomutase
LAGASAVAGRAGVAHARINPALRRPYDLRGVFGKTLTAGDAYGVGRRFAALARGARHRPIAASHDGRLSAPALEAALVAGLRDGGAHVFRLPLGPTPLLSFTIRRLGLDGGVMVTASHDAPDRNGFKLLLGGSAPLFGAALRALWEVEPTAHGGGCVEDADISGEYLAALAAEVAAVTPVAITWDSGNGATGELVERLVHRIPGRHFELHTEIDGRFLNHRPDPAAAETLDRLAATVRRTGSDLGVAFDGDGDRIGVVDSTGAIIAPDQLLLLLARDMLRERPGSAVVTDVRAGRVLLDGIAAAGGQPLMAPCGSPLVRERMLQAAAPLAGTMRGHIFFGDRWHHADDALYVAMRTVRALAHARTTLRQFRESLPPVFATPEIRLSCPADRKAAIVEHVAARLAGSKIDRTDGVRVTEEGGWWLLRASATQPQLAARCEAQDAAALKQLKSSLGAALREAGVDAGDLL